MLLTKKELLDFISSGLNSKDIADIKKCCRATIRNYINKNEIIAPKGFWVNWGNGNKLGRPPGVPMSNKQKKAYSDKFSGKLNPFYGQKHSPETRQTMKENHADFTGDKNPYKKSLQNPAKREDAKVRAKKRWDTIPIEKRIEMAAYCRTGCGEVNGTHWASIKGNAKSRKLEFSITPDYAWELFLKQESLCALSGVPLFFKGINQERTASLDRIDSSKGYIIGNVQWVHKTINLCKHSLPDNIFIDWCRKVTANNSII